MNRVFFNSVSSVLFLQFDYDFTPLIDIIYIHINYDNNKNKHVKFRKKLYIKLIEINQRNKENII